MSREIEMMIEGLAADVIQIIMEEEGLDFEHAMDKLYTSDVFRKLERPETGLYYQSPVYVYDCLKQSSTTHCPTSHASLL